MISVSCLFDNTDLAALRSTHMKTFKLANSQSPHAKHNAVKAATKTARARLKNVQMMKIKK